jgi:hypothetical protein
MLFQKLMDLYVIATKSRYLTPHILQLRSECNSLLMMEQIFGILILLGKLDSLSLQMQQDLVSQ